VLEVGRRILEDFHNSNGQACWRKNLRSRLIVKTILKCFWLFAFLALAASLEAQPAQSFSWTVTGTGTETWYTSITNYTSQTASIYGSDSPPSQSISITAGASGQGTFEAYIIAGPGYGLSYAYMFSGSTTLFQYCVGNGEHPPNQTHGPLYFMAETNATYDLKARVVGAGYSSVTVTVPQSIQPQTNTAPRQATATGTNSVSISDGKKTINGLSAPPQPANGGSISNVTYSLTWNNPSVSLVFSDTLTTSTLNPTSIVAVAPFPGQPTHLSTTTNYAGSGGWVTIGISWSPAPWATGYEFVSAKAVNGVVQTPVTNAVAGTNFLDTGHPPGTLPQSISIFHLRLVCHRFLLFV